MSQRNHKRKLGDLLNQYTDEALRKGLTPESPELPHIAKYDKNGETTAKIHGHIRHQMKKHL